MHADYMCTCIWHAVYTPIYVLSSQNASLRVIAKSICKQTNSLQSANLTSTCFEVFIKNSCYKNGIVASRNFHVRQYVINYLPERLYKVHKQNTFDLLFRVLK